MLDEKLTLEAYALILDEARTHLLTHAYDPKILAGTEDGAPCRVDDPVLARLSLRGAVILAAGNARTAWEVLGLMQDQGFLPRRIDPRSREQALELLARAAVAARRLAFRQARNLEAGAREPIPA